MEYKDIMRALVILEAVMGMFGFATRDMFLMLFGLLMAILFALLFKE